MGEQEKGDLPTLPKKSPSLNPDTRNVKCSGVGREHAGHAGSLGGSVTKKEPEL